MRTFFNKIFNLQKSYLYFFVLVSFLLIAFHHFNAGFSMSGDSHKFSKWADKLINFNFNFYDFFIKENSERIPPLFYIVPVFLIAICKVFFGDLWQFVFLSLNLLFVLLSLIIFTKTLLIIKVRPFLILLSLPLIILSVDLLTWPKFILSDMLYAFLVVLVTYIMAKGFVNYKYNYIQLFITIFFIFLTRPSSVSVILPVLLLIIISKYQFILKPKVKLGSVILLIILIPLTLTLIFNFIEFNYSDNTTIEWWLLSKVKVGMIIHDRPETWVDPPNNFLDIAKIYFLRLISFFNPYASTFSLTHIILNFFQTFLIVLSVIIWIFYGTINFSQNKLIIFIILLSLSIASFHSFTLIDYDWRYRFPTILPLIMIIPISLEKVLKKIS